LKRHWPALALLSPSLIVLAVFVYGFIGTNIQISLTDEQGLNADSNFIGFDNYLALLDDPRFHIDVWNTGVFSVAFIGVSLFLGLGLAILLDQKMKAEGFFRSIYLLPMAVSFIVTGVVWRWLMNPAEGSRMSGLNLLFDTLGLDFLVNQWHLTPTWGMLAIALPAVWQMSGYTMALFLAGLRSVPDEVKEAARMDGASELAIYWRIILPMIRPVALSAVVILGHISLKVFDLIILRNNKFTDAFAGNPVLFAVFVKQPVAAQTMFCLEAIMRVIDTGMYYFAVATADMLTKSGFLLQQDYAVTAMRRGELSRYS